MIFQVYNLKVKTQTVKTASQSGVTLLLSILILSAILAIAFSLATVTFVEVRSSGDLIRTEPAYYAADAISEEALFKVKRKASDTQLTYSNKVNNVGLSSSESYFNTAIFQTVVSKAYNSFSSTRSHFPIFDINCPSPISDSQIAHCVTGGSGYGQIKLTYLDTGNTDSLKVYICQFDPQQGIDPSGEDPASYVTLPCSEQDPENSYDDYWLVQGEILTNSPSSNTRTVTLDPNKQQEIILYNNTGTADIHVLIETFDENLQAKGLPLVGSKAIDIQASSSGVVRKIRTIIPVTSSAGSSVVDTVWVEDSLPAGANPTSTGGDSWNWINSNPAPYSGSLAHTSNQTSGIHQHYFTGATGSNALSLSSTDTLFAYVYINPSALPSTIMLQWNDGSWEHRAYWGTQGAFCQPTWGSEGTNSRRYMGALPNAGQWVKLEVPVSQVGLSGATLNGMAFTLCDGQATWDRAGKTSIISTASNPNTASLNLTGQSNSYAQVSNYSSLNTSVFTVEAWIYPRRLNYSTWQPIVVKENSSGSSRNYGLFITQNASKVHYSFQAADCGTYRSYDTVGNLTLNAWNHIAMTYDGISLKAYLNGNLDSSQTPPAGICTSSQTLWIGGGQSVYAKNDALIDEVRIWNTARTQSEISANMSTQLSGSESGLVGYWKFNENSGNSASNYVSGGNAANFGSQAGWSTTVPFP